MGAARAIAASRGDAQQGLLLLNAVERVTAGRIACAWIDQNGQRRLGI